MIILQTSDFKEGKFKIPQNSSLCVNELDKYILRYEKKMLVELLGASLATEFINDLIDGVPQTQKFLDIFNEFSYDIDNCSNSIIFSQGIKSILQGFIFFYYMRDFKFARTLNGVVVNESENTRESYNFEWGLSDFYNESINDSLAIQRKIIDNLTDYPTFNGIKKRYITI